MGHGNAILTIANGMVLNIFRRVVDIALDCWGPNRTGVAPLRFASLIDRVLRIKPIRSLIRLQPPGIKTGLIVHSRLA